MAKKKRKNRPTKLAVDVIEARSFVLKEARLSSCCCATPTIFRFSQ